LAVSKTSFRTDKASAGSGSATRSVGLFPTSKLDAGYNFRVSAPIYAIAAGRKQTVLNA
jgi:hypothetical protein